MGGHNTGGTDAWRRPNPPWVVERAAWAHASGVSGPVQQASKQCRTAASNASIAWPMALGWNDGGRRSYDPPPPARDGGDLSKCKLHFLDPSLPPKNIENVAYI